MTAMPSLVGLVEIAVMFGVQQHTAGVWRYRDLLPTPDHMVSTTPVWEVATIRAFARTSGRTIVAAPPVTRRTSPPPAAGPCRIVGVGEIAAMFGVKAQTAAVWRYRGTMPAADYVISGTPVWDLATIVAFGRSTGRAIVSAPPASPLDGRRPGGIKPAEQRGRAAARPRRLVGRRPSTPLPHAAPDAG